MAVPSKFNFKIYQGSTKRQVFRWESATKVFKNITNITKAAPAVITAAGHELVTGWRFKIADVVGMKEINSADTYHTSTAITTDTITIGALSTLGYTAYTSGGAIEYNAPESLAGCTARMQIRLKLTSTDTIDELTTENGKILLDDISKTITILIDAVDTEVYTFNSAVYSLEIINGEVVTPLVNGNITLVKEVTR